MMEWAARPGMIWVCCAAVGSPGMSSARVSRCYAFAIGKPGDNGFGGWTHIGDRCSSHQDMACGTGIKDSPCFDGGHVKIDGLERGNCGKGIILGGVGTTLR